MGCVKYGEFEGGLKYWYRIRALNVISQHCLLHYLSFTVQ